MAVFIEIFNNLKIWGTYHLFSVGDAHITLLSILGLGLTLVLTWRISNFVENAIRHTDNSRLSSSAAYALGRMTHYTIWIFGGLFGLNWVGFDMQNLAIVGGAIGVGVGFGLQNIFSNFISGIIILLEKTLKIGDFVDLQSGVVGTVTEIGMRFTRVTTNDSVDIVVPNSEFVNGRVTNWTFDEMARRIHIPFGVAYGCDKDSVREAGIAAAHSIEGTLLDGKRAQPDVWLVGFGDSSLDFELVVWVNRQLMISPASTNSRYLWALETELTKRGIEIPFPQRDLHVRSGRLTVAIESKDQASAEATS